MRKYRIGDTVYYYIRDKKATVVALAGSDHDCGYKYKIRYTDQRETIMYECLLFSQQDMLQKKLDKYVEK